jgi:hypothetical protein
MKNQTWPAGDSIRSFLIDSDGTEVAWRESKREFNMPSHTGRSETEVSKVLKIVANMVNFF